MKFQSLTWHFDCETAHGRFALQCTAPWRNIFLDLNRHETWASNLAPSRHLNQNASIPDTVFGTLKIQCHRVCPAGVIAGDFNEGSHGGVDISSQVIIIITFQYASRPGAFRYNYWQRLRHADRHNTVPTILHSRILVRLFRTSGSCANCELHEANSLHPRSGFSTHAALKYNELLAVHHGSELRLSGAQSTYCFI